MRIQSEAVPLDHNLVSLPPHSKESPHRPQPILRFLPFPLNVMFSDEGFSSLILRKEADRELPIPRAYNSFASRKSEIAYILMLKDRGQVRFEPYDKVKHCHPCGTFAVLKSDGLHHRALTDKRPRNCWTRSMAQVQEIYDSLVERAGGFEACGAPERMLVLPNPGSMYMVSGSRPCLPPSPWGVVLPPFWRRLPCGPSIGFSRRLWPSISLV